MGVIALHFWSVEKFMPAMFILFLSMLLQAEIMPSDALHFSGATTIQPIIEKISRAYFLSAGGSLQIKGGGSETGLKDIANQSSDIAMVSRNLSDEERANFTYMTIGYDALAIIYHSSQPIKNLTKKELIELYDGSICDWKEIGGKSINLIVISKKIDRGTLAVFEAYTGLNSPKHNNLLPNAKLIRADAWESEANINATLWVSGLKGAIGYVSYAEANRYEQMGYPIRISAIENVHPSIETIKNGTYPIKRELNLVWNKENLKVKQFIGWVKSGGMDSTIAELGFVAVGR